MMNVVSQVNENASLLDTDGAFRIEADAALPTHAVILKAEKKRRNLVFVRIGSNSEFLKWFRPSLSRNWDVALSFYQVPDELIPQAIETIIVGGLSKFSSVKNTYDTDDAFYTYYERILFLDDDIIMKFEDVDQFFDCCESYNLQLAQPCLSGQSDGCWPFLKRKENTILRYTNFIEVMMPCFSRDSFLKCVETFDQSISAWGLDLVWPTILNFPERGLAVIDAVEAEHLRPFDTESGAFYTYLKNLGIDVGQEAETVRQRYGGTLTNEKFRVLESVAKPEDLNWLPDHRGHDYLYVLGLLHKHLNPRTYFEIGDLTGSSLKIANCDSIAVNPVFKLESDFHGSKRACHLFQMGSDEFFAQRNPLTVLGNKLDFVFLDGMHLAEFLIRDFINVEKYCNYNSIVAIHDCIPLDGVMSMRSEIEASELSGSAHPDWWTGDVWRAVDTLMQYRPDLKIHAFNAGPTGLVLITALDPESKILQQNYFKILSELHGSQPDKEQYQKYIEALEIQSTHCLEAFHDFSRYFWL